MRKMTTRLLFTAILASPSSFLAAQGTANEEATAATKIEQFTSKTGAVLIRGSERLGGVPGLYNSWVAVEVIEYIDVAAGTREYGIEIETGRADGDREQKHSSSIDFDEIDSLIQGIDYLARTQPTVTKLSNFRALYSTKDGLRIATFSSDDGILASFTSGQIGGASAFFNPSDIQKIKLKLIEAKQKIESIK